MKDTLNNIYHTLTEAVSGKWRLVGQSHGWLVTWEADAKRGTSEIPRANPTIDHALGILEEAAPWRIEDVLGLIRQVVKSREPPEVRWLLSVQVAEAAALATNHSLNPPDHPYFALLHWVRWSLLSEPFRGDGFQPLTPTAFPGGTDELRLRAREARDRWAEILLTYDDWPILTRVGLDIEREGKQLVFEDEGRTDLLALVDSRTGGDRSRDPFIPRLARELFTRRFMLGPLWRATTGPKLLALALLLAALLGAVVAGVGGWATVPPDTALAGAAVALFAFVVTLAAAAGEGFSLPFLLRFPASAGIGLAAVVASRGTWIQRMVPLGSSVEPECQVATVATATDIVLILGSLVLAGVTYLVVESRLHGTSAGGALRRGLGVWVIGLGWATIIAAFYIVLFGPLFTECFPIGLAGWPRVLAFAVTTLAVLDIGIFLQVLWEDRPVTYPLGALRFSRYR